jgi:hypothetical protein
MAHDQEVVGSNPGTVYWMDVSHLLKEKSENKGSQMGHTKKKYLTTCQCLFINIKYWGRLT